MCATGFCAFPDPNCDSQFRYGDHSGPSSGQCVGAENPDIDAMIDADETPTPDGAVCYGASIVHPCFANVPTGNVTVPTTLNTTNSPMCAALVGANANAWCVIAGGNVAVNGTVNVTGTRPLVLVATGTINVQGILDVASHRGGTQGPASDAAGCNAGTAPTQTSGGAGGSFGGNGGGGAATNGGTGGVAGGVLSVTALRGGCPGQAGSDAMAMNRGGDGGHGGGAVWLFAGTSISIGGNINASGSSGVNADAASSSGGGGGGAGGYVGLESPSITVSGSVFANGGGGGEASGNASTGLPGTDSPNATTAGLGGNGGSAFGSDGGNGSLAGTLNGQAGSAVCTTPCTTPPSGGGGGGGAGIIKTVPANTLGNVSPPST